MSKRRVTLLASATLCLWSIPLAGQLPTRMVTATAVMTVTADRLDVTGIAGAAVTSIGELVIGDPDDLVVVVVSREGAVRRFGRSGEGPGEFRNIRELGFSDGLIWVADSRLSRVSGFTPEGRLIQTVGYPPDATLGDGVRLSTRPGVVVDRKSMLHYATVISSGRSRLPQGTVGAVMQPTTTGKVRELIWSGVTGRCRRILDDGVAFYRPFCVEPFVTLSPNGHGVLTLDELDAPSKQVAFLATILDVASGAQTRINVVYRGRSLAATDWDRAYASEARRISRSPQIARAIDALPRTGTFPAYRGGVLLDDLLALVQVHPEDSSQADWLALRDGEMVGRLALPVGERPLAGTTTALWASTVDQDGLLGVTLYRLSVGVD